MMRDNKVSVMFPKVYICIRIEKLLKWLAMLNVKEIFIMREESLVLETIFFLLTEQKLKICKKPYYSIKCSVESLFMLPIELASTKLSTLIQPVQRIRQEDLCSFIKIGLGGEAKCLFLIW